MASKMEIETASETLTPEVLENFTPVLEKLAVPVDKLTRIRSLIQDRYVDDMPMDKVLKKHGISRSTFAWYMKKPEAEQIRTQLVPTKLKRKLALAFLQKASQALAHISAAKLMEASAQQLATTAGICLDKAQLLTGAPTEITETRAFGLPNFFAFINKS
jgi:hypothetical protein